LLQTVLTLTVAFLLVYPCYGQVKNDSQDTVATVTSEIGFPQYGTSGAVLGITDGLIGFSVSPYYVRSNQQVITIRYTIGEFNGFRPLNTDNDTDVDKIQELALLYGIMKDSKWIQASMSAGIGLARQTKWQRLGPELSSQQIGMALDGRVSLTWKYIGVGIQGYAHISKDNFWGVGAFIEVGKLW
jgi:hypothetical protein